MNHLKTIAWITISYCILQLISCSYAFLFQIASSNLLIPILYIFLLIFCSFSLLQNRFIWAFGTILLLLPLAIKIMFDYQLTHRLNIGFRYEINFLLSGYGIKIEVLSFSILIVQVILLVRFFKNRKNEKSNDIIDVLDTV